MPRSPAPDPNSLALRVGGRSARGPFRSHLELDPAAPPARRALGQIVDADGQVVDVLRLTPEEAADEFAVEALAGRTAARLDALNSTWDGLVATAAAARSANAPDRASPATPEARGAAWTRPRWASVEGLRALIVASFSMALIGGLVVRERARFEERQRRAEERITAETARSIQRELVRHFRREGTFARFPRRAPTLFPETTPDGGGMRATYNIVMSPNAEPNAEPNAHPASFVLRSRRGYTCAADVGVTPGALAAPSPPACGWGAPAP